MNLKRTLMGSVCGALAIPMVMSGCGNKTNEQASAPTDVAPAATGETKGTGAPPVTVSTGKAEKITITELDKITKAKQPFKLALVVKTRNNPFFSPMIEQAESEAKKLGVVLEVQAPAQETDKERQFAIVQDLTARKVDAILIAPADSKAIVPALKQAQAKGITVINLDNRVDGTAAGAAGIESLSYVGADNEAGGKLAGEAMAKALNGIGKVVVIEGIRGADNAEARKRGFENAVKGKLDIVASESANWDTQQAYTKCQSLLAAHPDLQGIFCANDKMALGAVKAIREANKKGKIAVVGYDNIPDVKQYLQSGEMKATIDQHPDSMGRYGVKLAVGVLEKSTPAGRELLVPLQVISR